MVRMYCASPVKIRLFQHKTKNETTTLENNSTIKNNFKYESIVCMH